MIRACDTCGGLYTTETDERYAGMPCQCASRQPDPTKYMRFDHAAAQPDLPSPAAHRGVAEGPAVSVAGEAEQDSGDEAKTSLANLEGSPRPAQASEAVRDHFRDHTSVTITVQEVANRLHQDIYGADTEHFAIHSCPCFLLARWYLGVSDKPRMYWPDGQGGNAWDKKNAPERDAEI